MGRKLEGQVGVPFLCFPSDVKSGMEEHSEDEPTRGEPPETKE